MSNEHIHRIKLYSLRLWLLQTQTIMLLPLTQFYYVRDVEMYVISKYINKIVFARYQNYIYYVLSTIYLKTNKF